MKRLNLKVLRIIAISVGAAIVIVPLSILAIGRNEKNTAIDSFEPALAPAEIAFSDRLFKQAGGSDFQYAMTSDGQFIVQDASGQQYSVGTDGNVYRIDRETGALTEVTDNTESNMILQAATTASKTDDTAALFFDTSPLRHMDLSAMTDKQIDQVLNETGDKFTTDDVRHLARQGASTDEVLRLGSSLLTAGDIMKLIGEGISAKQLADWADTSKGPSIIDQLQALLDAAKSPMTVTDVLATGTDPRVVLQAGQVTGRQTPSQPQETIPEKTAVEKHVQTKLDTTSTQDEARTAMTPTIRGLSVSNRQPETSQLASQRDYDPAAILQSLNSTSTDQYTSSNDQQGKKDFLSGFSENTSKGTYLNTTDVAAGTIIPMTLITGLNSDLPGQIVAQVSANIFDTLTGKTLLIPKGTRLIASYDSSVSWGQTRALIAWTQLIRPDGFVLQLPGLPGIDAAGYAGYQDKVNNHTWSFVGAALLASLMDLGVDEVVNQAEVAGEEAIGVAVDSFTGTIQTAGQKYLDRAMNRQPTLKIRPGRQITLLVTSTLSFNPIRR